MPCRCSTLFLQTGALKGDDQSELVIFSPPPFLKFLSFSITFYDLQLHLCAAPGSTVRGEQGRRCVREGKCYKTSGGQGKEKPELMIWIKKLHHIATKRPKLLEL